MTTVLQNYVREFGYNVTNGFDLDTWQNATCVEQVTVRMEVTKGQCTVRLCAISQDGSEEIWSHEFSGPGSASSPLLTLSEHRGILVPVFENESADLEFDLSFETDDAPFNETPKINYVACTFKRPDYIQKNAGIFQDFLERSGMGDCAHLTVVDNGGDSGVVANDYVTVLPNKNTGGAGGFGRGMYETCYGELKDREFTHVCLMDDDIYLHHEMFLRNLQLIRFLLPGHHVGAPMYPTSSQQMVPRTSSCFGHLFRGSRNPSDTSIGANLDTTEIADFVEIDRNPHSTGWWWDCIATEDIRRIGLPYPFFIKMDDVEYSLRLKNNGVKLVIPLSFWVLHDDFDEKYSAAMQYFRMRNRFILLAFQSRLGPVRAFRKHAYKAVTAFIRKRQYEHAELLLNALGDFMKGPYHLLKEEDAILGGVFKVTKDEKSTRIEEPPQGSVIANDSHKSSALGNLLDTASLGSHFLPIARKDLTIDQSQPNSPRDASRGRKITYWNGPKKAGYTVTTDPAKAAKLYATLLQRVQQLGNFPEVAKEYRKYKPYFISEEFWETYGKTNEVAPPKVITPTTPVSKMWSTQNIVTSPKTGKGEALLDRDFVFLNAIRNSHLGERCFVIGNGPSLKTEDLDLLTREYTFASNKIYLAFEKTKWRPTYYSVEDLLVAQNNAERITELTGTTKIFPNHMLRFIPRKHNHFYTRWLPPKDNQSPERNFSTDLSVGLCWGSTVTYSLIQMAVHMGFKEIYLLGIDHSYVESKVKDKNALVSAGEVNHFHPDYRKPGERWHLPVLDRLEHSYNFAAEYCESIGVKVYNASRKTELKAFPLVSLDDVLSRK